MVNAQLATSKVINWKYIKDHALPTRTTRQIRERYLYCLSPDIKKSGFSPEEDKIILSMQLEFGNCWAHIARQLDGRTEHAVKTRHKSLSNKIEKLFSPEADVHLLELARKYNSDWNIISKYFSGHSKLHLMTRFQQLTQKSSQ